jgi:hypothetical protein
MRGNSKRMGPARGRVPSAAAAPRQQVAGAPHCRARQQRPQGGSWTQVRKRSPTIMSEVATVSITLSPTTVGEPNTYAEEGRQAAARHVRGVGISAPRCRRAAPAGRRRRGAAARCAAAPAHRGPRTQRHPHTAAPHTAAPHPEDVVQQQPDHQQRRCAEAAQPHQLQDLRGGGPASWASALWAGRPCGIGMPQGSAGRGSPVARACGGQQQPGDQEAAARTSVAMTQATRLLRVKMLWPLCSSSVVAPSASATARKSEGATCSGRGRRGGGPAKAPAAAAGPSPGS